MFTAGLAHRFSPQLSLYEPQMGSIQVPTNRGVVRSTAHTSSETTQWEGQTVARCSDTDQSGEIYSKGKKPGRKEQIVYTCIYRTF